MRYTIFAVIMVAALNCAFAQTPDEIQGKLEAIREVESDSARLEAYDGYVDELVEARTSDDAAAANDTGDWTV